MRLAGAVIVTLFGLISQTALRGIARRAEGNTELNRRGRSQGRIHPEGD